MQELIDKFTLSISEKYSIKETELKNLWNSVNNKNIDKSSVISSDNLKESAKEYTRPELIELCKKNKLKCSGTKDELFSRLKKDFKNTSVIKKIVAPEFSIKKNAFGHYEHEETRFVFDKDSKVIAKQKEDGTLDSLTEDDIDLCNKYKFKFVFPLNLDTGKTKVRIQETEDSSNFEGDIESDESESDLEEIDEIED